MPRRRFVQDPKTLELVEVDPNYRQPSVDAPMLAPDFQEFVSPVDGKPVVGRRALREHNRRHGVTHAADFQQSWDRAAAERARIFQGESFDRASRIDALKHAVEKHTRRK